MFFLQLNDPEDCKPTPSVVGMLHAKGCWVKTGEKETIRGYSFNHHSYDKNMVTEVYIFKL